MTSLGNLPLHRPPPPFPRRQNFTPTFSWRPVSTFGASYISVESFTDIEENCPCCKSCKGAPCLRVGVVWCCCWGSNIDIVGEVVVVVPVSHVGEAPCWRTAYEWIFVVLYRINCSTSLVMLGLSRIVFLTVDIISANPHTKSMDKPCQKCTTA